MKKETPKNKELYQRPTVRCTIIRTEHALLAGSVQTTPTVKDLEEEEINFDIFYPAE